VTAVHQVVAGAGPYDAVSEQVRAWRRLLAADGLAGADHAAQIDPRLRAGFRPLAELEPGDGDLLVIRYSAWSPGLMALLDLPNPILLVYHNITPAEYLWNHNAGLAVQCAVGRIVLPAFARRAGVAVADSEFNAAELRAAGATGVRVIPILFDTQRLVAAGRPPAGTGSLVLVVGRLVPNKRHDRVLDAFAAYQRACAPDARLLLAGEPLDGTYRRLVEGMARSCGARNVQITGPLAQPELNAAYAAADVLLTLSEHEGFCVPLLEAFHFGVPVVAAPKGAMPGVAGDAALWTDDDPAVTAELLDLAIRDAELRAELTRRGRARLEHFGAETTAAAVREAVALALG
jgi:glycosyltransferase involved in cell wall biosynthesis